MAHFFNRRKQRKQRGAGSLCGICIERASHSTSVEEPSLPMNRSAGFQPAVSPISNRQSVRTRDGMAQVQRVRNPRYSRLETCAMRPATSLLRNMRAQTACCPLFHKHAAPYGAARPRILLLENTPPGIRVHPCLSVVKELQMSIGTSPSIVVHYHVISLCT